MGSSASKQDAQQPLPSYLARPVAILKPFYSTPTLQAYQLTNSIMNNPANGLKPDKNIHLVVSECRVEGLRPVFAVRISNHRIPVSVCGVNFKDAWAETRECLVDLGSGLEICHSVQGKKLNIYSSAYSHSSHIQSQQSTIVSNFESKSFNGNKMVFTARNYCSGSLTRFIIKGADKSSCTVFIGDDMSTSTSRGIPVARLFEKSHQQGSPSWWKGTKKRYHVIGCWRDGCRLHYHARAYVDPGTKRYRSWITGWSSLYSNLLSSVDEIT